MFRTLLLKPETKRIGLWSVRPNASSYQDVSSPDVSSHYKFAQLQVRPMEVTSHIYFSVSRFTGTGRDGLTKNRNGLRGVPKWAEIRVWWGRACTCIFCFAPVIQWICFSLYLPTVDCISCKMAQDW